MDPNSHCTAIVALRLDTGALVWSFKTGADVWTGAIVPNFLVAKDFDFSSGAMLYTINNVSVVGAASKGGVMYVLNRETGALIWKTSLGGGNSKFNFTHI